MANDPDQIKANHYTSISFGEPESLLIKWIHSHWSKRRGRAFLIKKLLKYFPGLNRTSLRIHSSTIPLDLRNDADIGYFFDVGIAHETFYQKVLLALIENGTVFYDVGSNLGYYSLLLSPMTKQIYAFEPNPSLADRLTAAVKNNAIKNVDVFNIGLSDTTSKMTFYYDASRHNLGSFLKNNAHKDSIDVFVNMLDEVVQKEHLLPAHVIKIDTEGYELPVLQGYGSLQQHRPILLIEWDGDQEGADSKNEKLMALMGSGYYIYKIGHDECLVPWHVREYSRYSNLLLLPQPIHYYPAIEKWVV